MTRAGKTITLALDYTGGAVITRTEFLRVTPEHHCLRDAHGNLFAVKRNEPQEEGNPLQGPRIITLRSGPMEFKVHWRDGVGIVHELGYAMQELNHPDARICRATSH